MGQWKILLVLHLLLVFSSQHYLRAYTPYGGHTYRYNDLFIDCGALYGSDVSDYHGILEWQTDEEFIKSGETKQLLTTGHTSNEMNTLRFFPKGFKNCYTLPFFDAYDLYFFRAGFYYGNYDGLYKPPSFGLEIDGFLWANVTASMSDEPVFHELVYILKKPQTRVCLVHSGNDDEVPFISSLEAKNRFEKDMYMELIDNNTALYPHSRINYGANKTVEKTMTRYDECCNRKWESKQMTDYFNINSTYINDGPVHSKNNPPWKVMDYAIQAKNITDSIYLSVDFSPLTTTKAFFVLYFMDPVSRFSRNQTSKVEIYINNIKMGMTDVPDYRTYVDQCHTVSMYPIMVSGSVNVTIAPSEGSTLAPILNAMEVFSAIDVSRNTRHLLSFFTQFVVFLHLLGLFVIVQI